MTPRSGNIIGQAILRLRADSKQLTAGLNKAKKASSSALGKMQAGWKGFANRIPVVGGALAGIATPAGAATAAIGALSGVLIGSIKSFVSTGDEIQKMALRTGFSTEALSEMRHALKISGSDIKSFEKGIKRMSKFHLRCQGRTLRHRPTHWTAWAISVEGVARAIP